MAMAMRRRQRETPAPNGALIVWMAGLVLGAGIGIVLIYHFLLGSHARASRPLRDSGAVTQPLQTGDMRQEHAEALREAMKKTKN